MKMNGKLTMKNEELTVNNQLPTACLFFSLVGTIFLFIHSHTKTHMVAVRRRVYLMSQLMKSPRNKSWPLEDETRKGMRFQEKESDNRQRVITNSLAD